MKRIDFPLGKDFVAIDRTFKQFMNSEIHNEVKSITNRIVYLLNVVFSILRLDTHPSLTYFCAVTFNNNDYGKRKINY